MLTIESIKVMAAEAVAAHPERFGTASAAKRGRNPRWPYVPVVKSATGSTSQVLSLAYATRQEALDKAQAHIDHLKTMTINRMADPSHRALRAWYGLARELDDEYKRAWYNVEAGS
jgi:hypothetical protein